jgi:hypothetical protein
MRARASSWVSGDHAGAARVREDVALVGGEMSESDENIWILGEQMNGVSEKKIYLNKF